MGMKNLARREAEKLAQLQDPVGMEGVVEWKRKRSKPFPPGACFQFTLISANDDLRVTSLPKPPRKFHQLALPAAQTPTDVDMSDLQGPRGKHEVVGVGLALPYWSGDGKPSPYKQREQDAPATAGETPAPPQRPRASFAYFLLT
jgi:hypothetical protein